MVFLLLTVAAASHAQTTITGLVVDSLGQGVARVGVTYKLAEGPAILGYTMTATDGAFTLLIATEKDSIVLPVRSEEKKSELQSLMRISYDVYCVKKKKKKLK